MSRKTLINIVLIFGILVLAGGFFWAVNYANHLPEKLSQHETIVLGQNRLAPGSQAALRVVVRDSKDGAPLEDAHIEVALHPAEGGSSVGVFEGQTDDQGTATVSFKVPDDISPDQVLVVRTQSKLGSDTVERPVQVERQYRLLLTTDKPIYQPGQVMHVRALALSDFDLTPASSQSMEFVIADGKGNKVFRQTVNTSDYGVAAVDFQLAPEAGSGSYKISASMQKVSSEKTVSVENYVLPKFGVDIQTEKAFYLPGEHVSGTLNASYFYGKPVAGSQVLLEGYTFDVERVVDITLQGTTDENGDFDFEFDLPSYVAGSDLEGGMARYYLQASITDQAQHTEVKNTSMPISGSALVIEAMPEGGRFQAGVENILYVLTSYPDGSPAEADLTVTFYDNNTIMQTSSGEYGIAEIRLTPTSPWQNFSIQARDRMGNTASREFYFEGSQSSEEGILLRPDKPIYQVGESMDLSIFTSQPSGTVYLDIVRSGQTVSTRSVPVQDGQSEVVVDLTPDLYGTLELHAYKILSSGTITRDTRLVVVDNASDLNISISPDQNTYLPGDTANLGIQVQGNGGAGVQSALGLAVVDESVFALAEQDPGFAKLYFMLEQEILQPRYELHGFSLPDLVSGLPVSDQGLRSSVEGAAQASLGAAAAQAVSFSLEANSHKDNLARAYDRQEQMFGSLSKGIFGLFLLFPVGMIALSIYGLVKQKVFGRSILLSVAVLILLALIVFIAWFNSAYSSWGSPLSILNVLFDFLYYGGGWVIPVLGLLGLASFIILAVYAGIKKDGSLGWMLGILILTAVTLVALVYAVSQSQNSPPDIYLILALAAFLLVPFAFLLRSSGYAMQLKVLPGLAGFVLALFILVALPAAGTSFSFAAAPRGAFGLMKAGDVMVEAMEIPPMMAAPTQAAAMPEMAEDQAAGQADQPGEPPRLRQYFPETMLWLPDAVTDENGSLDLQVPVADSITTWRITALASSQDGRLGSTTAPLRVFQDFFIDLDLPLSLTVGDEISVPVGVFNYLPDAQTVKLQLEQADWFKLLDQAEKQIDIAANDISVVYFRIRALDFGRQSFKVTAMGSSMSDAILKEVQVYPDGKQIRSSQSDRLNPDDPAITTVTIPQDAIPGTQTLAVKVYPGVMSQIVEGLDSILRMPNGCFEQTSSTTYPNVLVMDYLQASGQISPEVQMKAEEYINLGYQRLLTFEVQGSGGFSLFGDAPADPMLTAYGLQEFNDMSRVHPVDTALLQRIAGWLKQNQNSDGSWQGVEGFHESGLTGMVERLPVTAYVVWGMADAGYGDDAATQKGVEYLREFQSKAEDAYTLALVANALVAVDVSNGGQLSSQTTAVLERLAGMAHSDGSSAYWESSGETVMGSYGQTGNLETTALAALALLRSSVHPELANAALTYLVQSKDSFGTWDTTQATVMALKAFMVSLRGEVENVNAEVTVSLNDGQTRKIQVTPDNFDVVQYVSFDDISIGRDNRVSIDVSGKGNLMYQVAASYYLPWDKLALYPEVLEGEDLVTVDVSYDRTQLAVNDSVEVSVKVSLNAEGGKADSAIIDLGLPPGFSLQSEDLAALVAYYNDVPEDYPYPTIQRYELTGRQIIVYISNLSYEDPVKFSYHLLAKYPLEVQTPSSSAYDYYNPDVSGEQAPLTLVVTE